MGLAILPARLRGDLSDISGLITEHMGKTGNDSKAVEDICGILAADENLHVHEDWIRRILTRDIQKLREKASSDSSEVLRYIKQETGTVFSHVLENAGVYKQTPEGLEGFLRFTGQFE